jgi:hypothetical protein
VETPLLAKNNWKVVANLFPYQNSNKFMRMHKSFEQIKAYKDISREMNNNLNPFRPTTLKEKGQEGKFFSYGNERPWKFIEHKETGNNDANNLIGTSDRFGDTALHCCVQKNLVDLARVVITAGVDVNAENRDGHTALVINEFYRDCRCYAEFFKLLTNSN